MIEVSILRALASAQLSESLQASCDYYRTGDEALARHADACVEACKLSTARAEALEREIETGALRWLP